MKNVQEEMREWWKKNFPEATSSEAFMGVVEEVGELAHAELKHKQGIRGLSSSEMFELAAKDAVGDIVVFLAHYCELKGWSMDECVEKVMCEVLQRDWT